MSALLRRLICKSGRKVAAVALVAWLALDLSGTYTTRSLSPTRLLAHFNVVLDPRCPTPVNNESSQDPVFLIEETQMCRRQSNLKVVAYVHSAIWAVDKREETRGTWGTVEGVAVVFVVGRAANDHEEGIVTEESHRYRDIVQVDLTDTYHLLSHKALAALRWVQRHCSHVPWTMHADDDVLIDTFLLTKYLAVNGTRKGLMCYLWEGAVVRRVGRWCVTPKDFPKHVYPSYCAGGAWFMATNLTDRLLQAQGNVPFLWVDDVYLTGLLALSANLSRPKHLKRLIRHNNGISEGELGHTLAWLSPGPSRREWWRRIVQHHQKQGGGAT